MKKIIFSGISCAAIFACAILAFSCHSEETEIDIIDSVTPLLQKIIRQQNELMISAKTETVTEQKTDSTETLAETTKEEQTPENLTDKDSMQNQTLENLTNIDEKQNSTQENTKNTDENQNQENPENSENNSKSSLQSDNDSKNSEKTDIAQEEELIPPPIPVDTIPPEKVTDIKAVNLDSAVSLTWKDPPASDLFGIEITVSAPAASLEESRTLEPLKTRTIIIAPETEYAFFNNLQNGTQYTFLFTALDISGNRSPASQKKITPKAIALAPMTIKLSATDSEIEDDSVKIQAEITSLSPLYRVKYAPESRTSTYFKSRGEEITPDENSYSFCVNTIGTYTVYARDLAGRQETAEITIKKIPLNKK